LSRLATIFCVVTAGLIGDYCALDSDCYVANSNCVSSQCQCSDDGIASDDNTACIGKIDGLLSTTAAHEVAPRSRQITTPAPHAPLSFLQAGCPSCRPTNSVKALTLNVIKS